MSTPVWTYWEGPLPDWIAAARATIGARTRCHRALGPAGFDALWDRDRDLDLSGLHVVHRADVIRAFLLARYGGLWVDADCIVMHDLDRLPAWFAPFDFVAYRERDGTLTNAFVYAPPGSATAAAWYARICELLRRGADYRRWRVLGGEALEYAFATVDAHRLVFASDLIQPIPWDAAGDFMEVSGDDDHAARLSGTAICYMLSNQSVSIYQREHPGTAIDADGTFFRYLIARARAGAGSA